MKPRNFPGRKNDRRVVALLHMKPPPAGLPLSEIAKHPHDILRRRILPDAMARAIRTKKDRSARGKLR